MYLSVQKVAERLGVSRNSVRRWIREGRLRVAEVPGVGTYRIPEDAVEEFWAQYRGVRLKDAARVLDLHPESLRRLCRSGRIQARKAGAWYIYDEAVLRAVRDQEAMQERRDDDE
jgi:excisionase family DNA binding protein